jgi:drug/metabolite transporter (DMT)-like permease
MIFLGERPGASEFVALALVLASLAAVMFPERRRAPRTPSPP